jgi:hypothetical protein
MPVQPVDSLSHARPDEGNPRAVFVVLGVRRHIAQGDPICPMALVDRL